mgnify:CR=1 FL=1
MPKRKSNPEPPRGKRKRVTARTPNQKKVLQCIKSSDITLCEGPAGSGKTHLSVGAAVEYFLRGDVEKIVVTRPIVQAGERIGFLPGTAEQKLDPYLQPVFDEFSYFLSQSEIAELKNSRKLEVVPLALMRGRNFHKAFIIGDEMQNATYDQIKMFITRMGINSKLVISGDSKQSDLEFRNRGAFNFCLQELVNIDRISICYLKGKDIVRNPIIPIVLERLDEAEEVQRNKRHS